MPLKRGSKAVFCPVGACKKRYFSDSTLEDHVRSAHPKTKQARALGPAPASTKSSKKAGKKSAGTAKRVVKRGKKAA